MSVCGDPESISVLILDGENELDTVKVLRCLNESRGLTVHILSASRLPLSRLSRHHAHLHRHSSQNDDEWTDAIEKVARRLKIDVILPATLEGIRLVSQRREAISKVAAIPPIPEFKTLELVRNKWSLYRFAKQHGLPVVPSVFVGRPREPIADSSDLASIEYPALLKPTVSSGGTGIVKVRTPCDLHAAWENKRIMEGSEYMLQSCIPGLDISFSVLCQGGEVKAHTIWRQLLPSRRPFCAVPLVEYTDDKEAVDVGKRLVSALRWDGIANIDFIFDQRDQTLKILEINPRFWGSLLGSLSAGVNFPLMSCLTAAGAECPDMRQTNRITYVRPAAALRVILGQLIGRRSAQGLKWRGSAIRYTCSDPLPELVFAIRKIAKVFRSKLGRPRI